MMLPIFNNQDEGYQIARSARFDKNSSARFSRTIGTVTNSRVFTFSAWIRMGGRAANICVFSGGADRVYIDTNGNVCYYNAASGYITTTTKIVDDCGYGHLVVNFDTTIGRCRIYWNGTLIGSTSSITASAQLGFNFATNTFYLGYDSYAAGAYFDGHMTEVHTVDGQDLLPSNFGATDPNTGAWSPIEYTGSHGAQGGYWRFDDNSNTTAGTLGNDDAGSNDLTPTNFSVAAGVGNDSTTDTPTTYNDGNAHGVFATLTELHPEGDHGTLRGGGLEWVPGTNSSIGSTFPLMPSDTNIYYAEVEITNGNSICPSVACANFIWNQHGYGTSPGANAGVQYVSNGVVWSGNGNVGSYASYTTGDTVGVAFQPSTRKVWFRDKTGAWVNSGDPGGTGAGHVVILTANQNGFVIGMSGASGYGNINFGQRPFVHGLPTGLKRCYTGDIPTTEAVVTSGSFTGNAATDGPIVCLNGCPSAVTINGNAVTWGTHAQKLAYGFKVISSAAGYNASGNNTFTATVPVKRKYAPASAAA